jgi:hypothetical protein
VRQRPSVLRYWLVEITAEDDIAAANKGSEMLPALQRSLWQLCIGVALVQGQKKLRIGVTALALTEQLRSVPVALSAADECSCVRFRVSAA